MSWTDSLNVTLPRGPFNGDIRWEVHFFGEREPVYLSGNSFYGPTDIAYGLSNGDLSKAHAAFGKIQMDLASEIYRLTFVKKSDGKTIVQKLPSGKPVKVSFNKNEITLDAGKYYAYFETDGSHSFPDFNSSRPDNPQKWGIRVIKQ